MRLQYPAQSAMDQAERPSPDRLSNPLYQRPADYRRRAEIQTLAETETPPEE